MFLNLLQNFFLFPDAADDPVRQYSYTVHPFIPRFW